MKKGILIFAHNSKQVDYALLAVIAGSLAKKNLQFPVSLVTDRSTLDWMKSSGLEETAQNIFEKIILTEHPKFSDDRRLFDGSHSEIVPFKNQTRSLAYELSPYDRTLLIDSDYLILSNKLNEYWNIDEDVLIAESCTDILNSERMGYLDKHISEAGINMFWATTVMFSKSEKAKTFFNLVDTIRNNYSDYSDIYRFNMKQYRNDISFSIAKHIIDGFVTDKTRTLPPIINIKDRDILYKIQNNNLIFLVSNGLETEYIACKVADTDIHIMNKQSLVRNSKQLLELANV